MGPVAPAPARGQTVARGPTPTAVTRFQKTALATVIATILLVTVGVIVRVTDSGMGCPDWPLCQGQVIPPLGDPKAWIEWIHRTIAAVIGFLILGVAFLAWKDHRDRRSILWPSIAAVLLVGFQAWLGRETVRLNNSGESVTAHMAAAMSLLGLLVYVTVRAFYPARLAFRGGSQRFTLLAVLTAASMFALLLVRVARDGAGRRPRLPGLAADERLAGPARRRHGPARAAAVRGDGVASLCRRRSCCVFVWVTAYAAWRTQRSRPTVVRLRPGARGAVPGRRSSIGGLQVLTQLADWTQTLHLALGAVLWALAAALATTSYYEARVAVPATVPATGGDTGPSDPDAGSGGGRHRRPRPRATRSAPTSR